MDSTDPLYPFTLALSYVEKCETEIAKWRVVSQTRDLDNTQYDAVLRAYNEHRDRAFDILDAIRGKAQDALIGEEAELDVLVAELRRLGREVDKERIKPAKANTLSRRIHKRLAPLQESLSLHQTIVETQSTSSLGGRLDFPLEEYPVRLRPWTPKKRPEPTKHPRHRDRKRKIETGPVVVVLLMIAAVAGLYYGYPAVRTNPPSFSILPAGDIVQIFCLNRSGPACFFYAPWPDGQADPQGRSPAANSYGVRLFVRPTPESTWRMLPQSDGAWTLLGETLLEPGPYRVDPGTSKSFNLDRNALRVQGVEAAQLRIEIVRAGGSLVEERVL